MFTSCTRPASGRCGARRRIILFLLSGLILAASLFTVGIICFIYEFIRYGMPVGAVDKTPEDDASLVGSAAE